MAAEKELTIVIRMRELATRELDKVRLAIQALAGPKAIKGLDAFEKVIGNITKYLGPLGEGIEAVVGQFTKAAKSFLDAGLSFDDFLAKLRESPGTMSLLTAAVTSVVYAVGRLAKEFGSTLKEAAAEWNKEAVVAERNALGLGAALGDLDVQTGKTGAKTERLVGFIEELSKQYGISTMTIEQSSVAFINQARSAGLSIEKIEQVLKLSAALATVYQKDFSTALYAVMRGINGVERSLRMMGITLTDAAVAQNQLGDSTGKLFKQLPAGQQQLLRLNELLKITATVTENASKVLDNSTSGALKRYEAATERLHEKLGQGVKQAWDPYTRAVTRLATALADLPPWLLAFTGAVTAAAGALASGVGSLLTWGAAAANVFVGLVELARLFSVTGVAVAALIGRGIALAGWFGLIVVGAAAASYALKQLWDWYQKLRHPDLAVAEAGTKAALDDLNKLTKARQAAADHLAALEKLQADRQKQAADHLAQAVGAGAVQRRTWLEWASSLTGEIGKARSEMDGLTSTLVNTGNKSLAGAAEGKFTYGGPQGRFVDPNSPGFLAIEQQYLSRGLPAGTLRALLSSEAALQPKTHFLDTQAINASGAGGIGQFLPSTARRYGLLGPGATEGGAGDLRLAAGPSGDATARYLADIMEKQTKGDLIRAILIYKGHTAAADLSKSVDQIIADEEKRRGTPNAPKHFAKDDLERFAMLQKRFARGRDEAPATEISPEQRQAALKLQDDILASKLKQLELARETARWLDGQEKALRKQVADSGELAGPNGEAKRVELAQKLADLGQQGLQMLVKQTQEIGGQQLAALKSTSQVAEHQLALVQERYKLGQATSQEVLTTGQAAELAKAAVLQKEYDLAKQTYDLLTTGSAQVQQDGQIVTSKDLAAIDAARGKLDEAKAALDTLPDGMRKLRAEVDATTTALGRLTEEASVRLGQDTIARLELRLQKAQEAFAQHEGTAQQAIEAARTLQQETIKQIELEYRVAKAAADAARADTLNTTPTVQKNLDDAETIAKRKLDTIGLYTEDIVKKVELSTRKGMLALGPWVRESLGQAFDGLIAGTLKWKDFAKSALTGLGKRWFDAILEDKLQFLDKPLKANFLRDIPGMVKEGNEKSQSLFGDLWAFVTKGYGALKGPVQDALAVAPSAAEDAAQVSSEALHSVVTQAQDAAAQVSTAGTTAQGGWGAFFSFLLDAGKGTFSTLVGWAGQLLSMLSGSGGGGVLGAIGGLVGGLAGGGGGATTSSTAGTAVALASSVGDAVGGGGGGSLLGQGLQAAGIAQGSTIAGFQLPTASGLARGALSFAFGEKGLFPSVGAAYGRFATWASNGLSSLVQSTGVGGVLNSLGGFGNIATGIGGGLGVASGIYSLTNGKGTLQRVMGAVQVLQGLQGLGSAFFGTTFGAGIAGQIGASGSNLGIAAANSLGANITGVGATALGDAAYGGLAKYVTTLVQQAVTSTATTGVTAVAAEGGAKGASLAASAAGQGVGKIAAVLGPILAWAAAIYSVVEGARGIASNYKTLNKVERGDAAAGAMAGLQATLLVALTTIGALVGSIIPIIGTAVGAALGASIATAVNASLTKAVAGAVNNAQRGLGRTDRRTLRHGTTQGALHSKVSDALGGSLGDVAGSAGLPKFKSFGTDFLVFVRFLDLVFGGGVGNMIGDLVDLPGMLTPDLETIYDKSFVEAVHHVLGKLPKFNRTLQGWLGKGVWRKGGAQKFRKGGALHDDLIDTGALLTGVMGAGAYNWVRRRRFTQILGNNLANYAPDEATAQEDLFKLVRGFTGSLVGGLGAVNVLFRGDRPGHGSTARKSDLIGRAYADRYGPAGTAEIVRAHRLANGKTDIRGALGDLRIAIFEQALAGTYELTTKNARHIGDPITAEVAHLIKKGRTHGVNLLQVGLDTARATAGEKTPAVWKEFRQQFTMASLEAARAGTITADELKRNGKVLGDAFLVVVAKLRDKFAPSIDLFGLAIETVASQLVHGARRMASLLGHAIAVQQAVAGQGYLLDNEAAVAVAGDIRADSGAGRRTKKRFKRELARRVPLIVEYEAIQRQLRAATLGGGDYASAMVAQEELTAANRSADQLAMDLAHETKGGHRTLHGKKRTEALDQLKTQSENAAKATETLTSAIGKMAQQVRDTKTQWRDWSLQMTEQIDGLEHGSRTAAKYNTALREEQRLFARASTASDRLLHGQNMLALLDKQHQAARQDIEDRHYDRQQAMQLRGEVIGDRLETIGGLAGAAGTLRDKVGALRPHRMPGDAFRELTRLRTEISRQRQTFGDAAATPTEKQAALQQIIALYDQLQQTASGVSPKQLQKAKSEALAVLSPLSTQADQWETEQRDLLREQYRLQKEQVGYDRDNRDALQSLDKQYAAQLKLWQQQLEPLWGQMYAEQKAQLAKLLPAGMSIDDVINNPQSAAVALAGYQAQLLESIDQHLSAITGLDTLANQGTTTDPVTHVKKRAPKKQHAPLVALAHAARGGLVLGETLLAAGEQNRPELVLPLSDGTARAAMANLFGDLLRRGIRRDGTPSPITLTGFGYVPAGESAGPTMALQTTVVVQATPGMTRADAALYGRTAADAYEARLLHSYQHGRLGHMLRTPRRGVFGGR